MWNIASGDRIRPAVRFVGLLVIMVLSACVQNPSIERNHTDLRSETSQSSAAAPSVARTAAPGVAVSPLPSEAPPDWNSLSSMPQAMAPVRDELHVTIGGLDTVVLRLTFDEPVLFDFDRATPKDGSDPLLDALAGYLGGMKNANAITIVGHTDAIGTDTYNIDLSRRRSQSVAAALMRRGVRSDMSIVAMGKRQPIAANSDDAGRARNRRVEIFVSASRQANIDAINLRRVSDILLRTDIDGAAQGVTDTVPMFKVIGPNANDLEPVDTVELAPVEHIELKPSVSSPISADVSAKAPPKLTPVQKFCCFVPIEPAPKIKQVLPPTQS
jgi:outer membrane protein OmpA-like peptidoglycan-associated protein